MTPIEMVLERIPAKQAGADSWMACCPAHADSSPSLSITLADDDKVLIHCHAGCKLDDVLVAVGMKRSDLFPPKQANDERRTLTDTYHYHDENGVLLYDVLRYWPKDFRQRAANGATGKGCMDGVRRVLYRLPHVIEAVKNGETVYITEGEKDADRLVREGYCATTAAQGAGKWKTVAGSTKYLLHANVVIIRDNDNAGRQHAADVYRDVRKGAKNVVIKQAAIGKDASDHFDAGMTIDELVDADTDGTVATTADGSTEIEWMAAGVDGIRYTDLGNAHRLIAAHGAHLRFVPAWNKWLAYDGGRWRDDHADTMVSHLAYGIGAQLCTFDNMQSEMQIQPTDKLDDYGNNKTGEQRVKKLIAWTTRSESSAGADGTISAASSIPGVAIDHEAFDAHPRLLNVTNGTVDLRTGTLKDHNPNDLLMMQTACEFDANATAPVFTKFIETVLPDAEVRRFVQQVMGLVLVGEQVEHLLCIAIGGGGNGKSTLTKIIAEMLGEYAVVASKDLLMALKHDTHPTSRASLFRKRFAHSGELTQGAKLDEAQIKELTGNDRIKARRMREDEWEYTPSHLLWLHANHRPNIVGTDDGIWRRVKLIPFTAQIPEAEVDPELPNKVRDGEGPGVLNWMLDGLADYRANRLVVPDIVRDGTKSYRNESDTIAAFLTEHGVVIDNSKSISANDLTAAHGDWYSNAGISDEVEKAHYQRLLAHLKANGVTKQRKNSGSAWLGVGYA